MCPIRERAGCSKLLGPTGGYGWIGRRDLDRHQDGSRINCECETGSNQESRNSGNPIRAIRVIRG